MKFVFINSKFRHYKDFCFFGMNHSSRYHRLCTKIPFFLIYVLALPCNLGLLQVIHTLIMEGTCQPGICHLTLTLFSWSNDFVKFRSSFRNGVNFSIAMLVSPYLDLISQSTDFLKFAYLFVIKTVFTLPYNPCLLYLVPTSLMMEVTCAYLCICHLSLI